METHRLKGEGFIKYAVQMGLGDMICIPIFINIGSGIQKGGIHNTQTGGDRINLI
jgi:hypothetical protein